MRFFVVLFATINFDKKKKSCKKVMFQIKKCDLNFFQWFQVFSFFINYLLLLLYFSKRWWFYCSLEMFYFGETIFSDTMYELTLDFVVCRFFVYWQRPKGNKRCCLIQMLLRWVVLFLNFSFFIFSLLIIFGYYNFQYIIFFARNLFLFKFFSFHRFFFSSFLLKFICKIQK